MIVIIQRSLRRLLFPDFLHLQKAIKGAMSKDNKENMIFPLL